MRALALILALCVAAFCAARSVARGAGAAPAARPSLAEPEARRNEVQAPRPALRIEMEPAAHLAQREVASERAPDDALRVSGSAEAGSVGCVLYGRVRFRESPFLIPEQAQVWLTRENETRGGQVRADGAYSISGIEPGVWKFHVARDGYRRIDGELELTGAEPLLRRDFVLEPGWLLRARVVTPDGESLNGFFARPSVLNANRGLIPQFVATKDAPRSSIPEAREGNGHVADGVYHTWDGVATAAGEPILEVLAGPPVHVSLVLGETVLETQVVEAGAEVVTFVFAPETVQEVTSTVRLRLVSGVDGEPLALGDIEVNRNSVYMFRGTEWSQTFPPGEYRFAFQSWGYATRYRTLTLAGGEELDLGDIALEPETRITGRVFDAEGRPARATFELGLRDDQGRVSFRDSMNWMTDHEGNFEIGGLAPGRYVLHTVGDLELALPEDGEAPEAFVLPNTELSTLAGSLEGIELRLARAGFLALRGAEAVARGSLCKVLDANGQLVAYGGFYEGHVPRFALPLGPHTFVLCDVQWQELRRFEFVIGAGITALELGE